MRKTTNGFTIVELLIVIVVIGILAAITIVVYNGIQDRADRSQTINAVNSYVKAVTLYAADKGTYPAYTNACLGGSENINNKCYKVSSGTATCTGSGAAVGNASFDNEIRPYMGGKLAVPSQKTYMCGGGSFAGALYYAATPTVNAYFYVILKASVGTCPDVGKTTNAITNTQDEIIICRYMVSNP